ncbi:hypothetical protein LINPERHAP2_LOCUS24973 [Linum perenne]
MWFAKRRRTVIVCKVLEAFMICEYANASLPNNVSILRLQRALQGIPFCRQIDLGQFFTLD